MFGRNRKQEFTVSEGDVLKIEKGTAKVLIESGLRVSAWEGVDGPWHIVRKTKDPISFMYVGQIVEQPEDGTYVTLRIVPSGGVMHDITKSGELVAISTVSPLFGVQEMLDALARNNSPDSNL